MSSTVPSLAPVRRSHYILIFVVMLILRGVCAFRFRVDADEPQHLHVIWGWVNGYLPYRDVFDNHGPLFHVLLAPLFRVLGERPDILILMRFAMIPFLAICLWCVYRVGTDLFSRNVGIWAAILTGFYPEYFLTSAEFRTDVLWTVLWLLALVTITRQSFGKKHAFLTGLLLGGCFGVTVKTGLMVGALGPWALMAAVRTWNEGGQGIVRSLVVKALAGLGGFVMVPGAALLFFAAQGMARQYLYYNIGFNLIPHSQNWERFDGHVLWFPLFLLVVLVVYAFVRKRSYSAIDIQRIGLVLTAGFYFTALKTFFPTLSRQDDLPVIPLATLVVVAALFFLVDRVSSADRRRWLLTAGFPLLAAIEILVLTLKTSSWTDNMASHTVMVADVLKATEKHEFVMDATGETIFRMRPFYYALEAFTKVRIERGLIVDDIAQNLIDTQTSLVRIRDLTKPATAFVRENYLLIGHGLWMVGKKVKPTEPDSRTKIHFETRIAARYTFLTPEAQQVMGELDGMPFSGERLLEPGPHDFVAAEKVKDYLLLFSARGFQRGFIPVMAVSAQAEKQADPSF
ncbi:MAG: glycosyltransferase family 39 protein [Chthoniobacter sp.]|uniref:glycosyltransferase family 39 protein n=1 Tax=Chthoniobacter sp. TaxID=2510640 RepID=UPI0032AB0ECA